MAFFLSTIIKWRRFVLVCGAAGAVVMTVIALVLPAWYRARTSLFPPEQSGVLPISDEIVKRLSSLMGNVSTGASPGDVCIEILKSRAVGEPLIEEFGLMQAYGARSIEECLDALHSHSRFALLTNGMVVVTFEDRSPERAAAIANRMVEQLDVVTRGLKLSRATRTREFVEKQMLQRKEMLAQAEDDLREFQQRNRTVDFNEQVGAAMELITTLSARAITLEIELKTLAHFAGPHSEEYLRRKAEYTEVVKQLGRLKGQGARSDDDLVRTYLPALSDLPELGLQYVRLRREVEVQGKVYKLLLAQYEKAGMEEARDVPVIQVLDHAVAPSTRARPNRLAMVAVGTLLDLLLGSMIALLLAALAERRGPVLVARELLAPITADLARLRGRAKP